MKSIRVFPCPSFKGIVSVPGDKSISHRAVMLAALAEGTSRIKGLLLGQDVRSTLHCFKEMGVPIKISTDHVEIRGVGLKGLKAPNKVLDCGNSGTTMRLMMGILAGQPFSSRLTGDASLNRRPMARVMEPLVKMGAEIEELRGSETERILKISGRPLRGIEYRLPIASAQVKSAILLAGLFAQGQTRVLENIPSRNHTELMLEDQGVSLESKAGAITLTPSPRLIARDRTIPGDISSAAFFLVAGCLGEKSKLTLLKVGINPTRTGILKVLEGMGAKIQVENLGKEGGEPLADLVSSSSSLRGTQIGGSLIPQLIDEIPILSIAATAAQGKTEVRDARELRVKESDRIQAIVREIGKFSAFIEEREDGFAVQGPTQFRAGDFSSHGDHRMAMSLIIGATQASGPSLVHDVACVDTSYPEFFQHLKSIGGKIEMEDTN